MCCEATYFEELEHSRHFSNGGPRIAFVDGARTIQERAVSKRKQTALQSSADELHPLSMYFICIS